MEVTLTQMLQAREDRVRRQRELNQRWGLPLISFSMNIPGPVKDTPLIRRGFRAGLEALDARLPREAVRHRAVMEAVTGWEAVYVLALPAEEVKAITTAIEDETALGRLFDMDVLDGQLNKLDRALVGGGSRDCLVCGAPGRGCASRRVHRVEQLQGAVYRILRDHFAQADAARIGRLAVRSLTDEVDTTPKPGLVDRRNTGSHRDMDRPLFHASARALEPYFRRCARIGMETADLPPEETFARLRAAGLEAEKVMLAATGGVNTHKGAIFTLGILCGAAGRLWKPEGGWDTGEIFPLVADMTRGPMAADFQNATGGTAGERYYSRWGIRGIRGEVAQGLPSVAQVGLPQYRACLEKGLASNDAGAVTLLHLIARVEDTCLIHRGGPEGAGEAVRKTKALLEKNPVPDLAEIRELDDWFIGRNLSPGGSADLLAAVYFLNML